MEEYDPRVILEIKNIDRPQEKALLKSSCLELGGGSALVRQGTCTGVRVRLPRHVNSNIHYEVIRLDGQREQDFYVEMENNQVWFPFDYYMIVGHMVGTQAFYVEGQVADMKRTVVAHWNTSEPSATNADLDATVIIRFSRSWCLQLLAVIFLGGGAVFGVIASWVYPGSYQQVIPTVSYLVAWLALRAVFLNHIPAFTILDGVLGAAFLACLMILMRPSPPHRRVRTN